jgi:hypothetical protein
LSSPERPLQGGYGVTWAERHHFKTLVSAVRGPLAAERAALFLSMVAGVQVMRQAIALPALADAEPEALAGLLKPLVKQLIG